MPEVITKETPKKIQSGERIFYIIPYDGATKRKLLNIPEDIYRNVENGKAEVLNRSNLGEEIAIKLQAGCLVGWENVIYKGKIVDFPVNADKKLDVNKAFDILTTTNLAVISREVNKISEVDNDFLEQ